MASGHLILKRRSCRIICLDHCVRSTQTCWLHLQSLKVVWEVEGLAIRLLFFGIYRRWLRSNYIKEHTEDLLFC